MIDRGWQARVVSIDLSRTPREWLGRIIDPPLAHDLLGQPDLDPCGERGEFHTFVEDGPLFRHPVVPRVTGELEMEKHLLLDLDLHRFQGDARPRSVQPRPSR